VLASVFKGEFFEGPGIEPEPGNPASDLVCRQESLGVGMKQDANRKLQAFFEKPVTTPPPLVDVEELSALKVNCWFLQLTGSISLWPFPVTRLTGETPSLCARKTPAPGP
jgi:hypothetical protein